ncbi:NAD-dependent epimerase/dehydratase family protein [Candidatus Peregrinibacteria bacterium]|nr:NAD-dependent epimerase/dehydratase family protein [Candidatus Peregrinibacteria bacterium]
MKQVQLKNILIKDVASIKEAMRNIDQFGLRMVFVVDKNNTLLGAVSDSEVRKAIIKGIDIKGKISNILNKNPIILEEKDRKNPYQVNKIIRELYERMPGSEYILAVDKKHRPSELIHLRELNLKSRASGKKTHRGKHILIVGGAGYLGTVLCLQLIKSGYRVRVLDSMLYGDYGMKKVVKQTKNKNIEVIVGDARNISTLVRALTDIDAVINLAAIVGDPACKDKPEMAIETNYLANKALADACKYQQINRFIYASTCSVYGQSDEDKELDENAPLNPVSLYARSKIQSEESLLSMKDENFSPIILRMSTLYGYSPRMRFDLVINTMTKDAVKNKQINVFGGGKHWRPLLSVDDAAQAYIKCLEAPLEKVKGEVFNVGSSQQNYRIIDIAKMVHTLVPGSQLMVEKSSDNDPRNYMVSFAKIEKLLKFKARHSVERAIQQMKQVILGTEIEDVNHPQYYNIKYLNETF